MQNQQQNLDQNSCSSIQTMSPSSTEWTSEGVCPFILNLEFNSMASLIRRRGTEEIYDISNVDPTYIRSLACSNIKIPVTNSVYGKYSVEDFGVVSYLTNTQRVKYFIFSTLNKNDSEGVFNIVQSNFSVQEEASLDYGTVASDRLGLQLISIAGEPNTFYILANKGAIATSNSTGFNVLKVSLAPSASDNTVTVTIVYDTDIKTTDPTPPNRFEIAQRAIAAGQNRMFVGEANYLHYTANVVPETIEKNLDKFITFPAGEIIVKIIEFDNFVFVITTDAVYKGQFTSGELNFNRISSSVKAFNAQSIFVKGNFCYIPTVGGHIYKYNIKSNNLEVDTYNSKVGEQVSAFTQNAYPVQTYEDLYSSTINFIYRGNLYALNSMLRKTDSSLGMSSDTPAKTVILSKHYKPLPANYEPWTSIVLRDADVVGCASFSSFKSYRYESSQNAFIPKTRSERATTENPNDSYIYSDNTDDEISPQTIFAWAKRGKIVRMTPRLNQDLGEAFPVIVVCPTMSLNEEAIINKQLYSTKLLEVLITTDQTQPSEYMPATFTRSEKLPIMITHRINFIGDLSTELSIDNTSYSYTEVTGKANVMMLKAKINTLLPNSGIMCTFKSYDINTFIKFSLNEVS